MDPFLIIPNLLDMLGVVPFAPMNPVEENEKNLVAFNF